MKPVAATRGEARAPRLEQAEEEEAAADHFARLTEPDGEMLKEGPRRR